MTPNATTIITSRTEAKAETRAWMSEAPGKALKLRTIPMPALGPNDLWISVSRCGVCATDLNHVDNAKPGSKHPFVPGHEVVGTVQRLGDRVKRMRVGDRVAVGWQAAACFRCEDCRRGDPNFCAERRTTYGPNGGFSETIAADARFALKVPDGIGDGHAGPLGCAGLTAYTALRRFRTGPGMRVGVLGLGGVGHLALQFAQNFGAHVTAVSSSPAKERDARRFGANEFRLLQDLGPSDRLDLLLVTGRGTLPWDRMLGALATDGTCCVVGIPPGPIAVDVDSLLEHRRSLTGSLTGTPRDLRGMFEFAAEHGVRPQVEVLPFERHAEALERVRQGAARYRMVLARN